MPNVIEITNPYFLNPGTIAWGVREEGGEWVGEIAWANYESATVRATTESACVGLLAPYAAFLP
jgi:CRP-like cAMP-binding protein